MISRIESLLRKIRRVFSRTHWAILLLRLPKLTEPTGDPGLVMVQIDGLSLTQFNRALQKNNLPFLKKLLRDERYVLHTFYSGLSSNTPAVQSELFYGIKGCIPAFYFMDRKLGTAVKMMDPNYVQEFEARLKEKAETPLLAGGSAYSNIFTGGAKEAHFCWAHLGWGGVLHAANPVVFPFLIILYFDIFVRMFFLLIAEFFIALYDCIRGTLKGRLFFRELELVWIRVLICILLRELIVVGACMDIMRGLPVIHLNFLGYDEQAHGRGPSSRVAHWALQGIDSAIQKIHHVIKQAPYREYDLWVYSDHGQDRTTPYFVQHGRTLEQAVEELFGKTEEVNLSSRNVRSRESRAVLLNKKIKPKKPPTDFGSAEALVTAMGPLGQIYVKRKLQKSEYDTYAKRIVSELKIPLVMVLYPPKRVLAYTPRGIFVLPEQTAEVFGEDHPFLEEIKEDLIRVCYHSDAGEFIIAGWCKGEPAISFPLEYGAHAGMSIEETRAFALLPIDAPVKPKKETYLRPLDLREAALRFLNRDALEPFFSYSEAVNKHLRLMSYNVHGCLGMDSHISTERIARVIARQNPDVVALQELDVGRLRSRGIDQVVRIARNLEMEYHFHPAFRYEDEQYGNAILSRFPMALIKMGVLPKLAEKQRYESRGAMWVSIDFQGTKIQIINTHLSVWPQERLLQINNLLSEEWLGHHDCYGPVILCGDFNALPGSTVYRKICQRLNDSQAILAGHRPHRTWFGNYPIGQIDHIFVTSEFQVDSIVVPRTTLDRLASDHLPLIVDLKFSQRIPEPNENLKEV
jgi:endonuclease/exonuclease/phosphatase family metal-dependent hydrolase